jgi:hypothetical protein
MYEFSSVRRVHKSLPGDRSSAPVPAYLPPGDCPQLSFQGSTELTPCSCSNQSQSFLKTDGQSASLFWYQTTICDPRKILSLPRKLSTGSCGFFCYSTPSLTRGFFFNLLVQVLLGLENAVTFESKSHRTWNHNFLPHFITSVCTAKRTPLSTALLLCA